ncbi:MAG: tetratricopeptide repeat protein [Alphaproteobacteria bacterium]|nr:tetratricopeptide repeat protein [Rhodospirillales bacterium]MCW9045352.1 tetratricopeptide repeat protein [Alphaproteobacteria bacterium]
MATKKKDKQENPEGDLFIKEVEEDLRNERQAELWKKYGNYVIGTAVGVVLIVAGYQGYTAYDRNQKETLSEQLTTATSLVKANKLADAQNALSSIANEGTTGYRVLAKLQQAAILSQKGDRAAASAIYWELADDSSVAKTYRDLATILGAMNGADDVDATSIKNRLTPLNDEKNAWRHSAKELLAVMEMKAGDKSKALEMFKQLSEDASTPQGVRTRANQLVAILGQ